MMPESVALSLEAISGFGGARGSGLRRRLSGLRFIKYDLRTLVRVLALLSLLVASEQILSNS